MRASALRLNIQVFENLHIEKPGFLLNAHMLNDSFIAAIQRLSNPFLAGAGRVPSAVGEHDDAFDEHPFNAGFRSEPRHFWRVAPQLRRRIHGRAQRPQAQADRFQSRVRQRGLSGFVSLFLFN